MLIELKAFGQPKHGFVDYDKVALALPDYELKQRQLKALSAQFDDSLNVMAQEYQRFLLNSIPHNVLDTTGLALVENKMRLMQTRMEDYQSSAIAELTKLQEDIKSTLRDTIVTAMTKFCEINKIVTVVDKDEILYCLGCIDFTGDFIEFMRKNE